jgi:hypothetical protein
MATRITEHTNGKTSDDTRYYIASRYTSGKKFSGAVRGHWGYPVTPRGGARGLVGR